MTRVTAAQNAASIAELRSVVAALTTAVQALAPAKAAPAAKATKATSTKAKASSTKTLTRAVLKDLKAQGKVAAGLTRQEALDAGLKGYTLPSGGAREAIKAKAATAAPAKPAKRTRKSTRKAAAKPRGANGQFLPAAK